MKAVQTDCNETQVFTRFDNIKILEESTEGILAHEERVELLGWVDGNGEPGEGGQRKRLVICGFEFNFLFLITYWLGNIINIKI